MPPNERDEVYLSIVDTRAAQAGEHRDRMQRAFAARPRPENPPPGLVRQLVARRHHDTWDRLDRISAPTLVQFGRFDGIAPGSNAEALASRLRDVRVEAYEGGHLYLWQDPRAFDDLIAFLTA